MAIIREYEILETPENEPVFIAGRGGRQEAGTRLKLNTVHGQRLVSKGQAAEVRPDGTLKRRRGRPLKAKKVAPAAPAPELDEEQDPPPPLVPDPIEE